MSHFITKPSYVDSSDGEIMSSFGPYYTHNIDILLPNNERILSFLLPTVLQATLDYPAKNPLFFHPPTMSYLKSLPFFHFFLQVFNKSGHIK